MTLECAEEFNDTIRTYDCQTGQLLRVETAPSGWDSLLAWFGDHWLHLLLIGLVLILLVSSVRIIRQKEAAVVERFGRYHRTMQSGLRFKIPLVERIAEHVDLQILRAEFAAAIKTKSNEFITLPVTVMYQAIPARAHDAYYEVEEPEEMISSLVQNTVKAQAATMTLAQIFDSRDEIQAAVEDVLAEKLAGYGHRAAEVVIDNPIVPDELMVAFNGVTVAAQQREAAQAQADALRIRMVGEAEAEAASLEIKGKSAVQFRTTIAEGNATAVLKMTEGTNLSHDSAFGLLGQFDRNDAIRDAAGKGATVVVATGNPSDGLYAGLPRA